MAIPIYVPEEYGPLPPPQPPSNTNCQSSLQSAQSRASFVHQLIEELYAMYQEYCAHQPAASVAVAPPEPNNNVSCIDFNNRSLELHPSRRFGEFGPRVSEIKPPHSQLQLQVLQSQTSFRNESHSGHHLTPPAAASPSRHNHDHDLCTNPKSKSKPKRSFCNGNNIGTQLRQVADTFEENYAQRHHVPKSSSFKVSWRTGRDSIALYGSLVFITGLATIFLTRRK